jgi:hypothetical protein
MLLAGHDYGAAPVVFREYTTLASTMSSNLTLPAAAAPGPGSTASLRSVAAPSAPLATMTFSPPVVANRTPSSSSPKPAPRVDWVAPEPVKSTRKPKESDYKKKSWFRKVDRDGAAAFLKGKPIGTFVVRPASKPGCLALAHVEEDDSIGHALIHMHDGSDGRFGYSIELSQRTYPTIEELLAGLPGLNLALIK